MNLSREFFTAGRATFTVEPSLEAIRAGFRPHYTYRIARGGKPSNRHLYFVSLFTGSDNTDRTAYKYLALMDAKTGRLTHTQRSCRPASDRASRIVARTLAAIFDDKGDEIVNAGWNVHHVGACCNCGRALTVPASIETGIGPECETFVKLGIPAEDVPCVNPRGKWVACHQLAYWIGGDPRGSLLGKLADEFKRAFAWDDARVELYADATRKLMRRHKKGAKLSPAFIANAKSALVVEEPDWRPTTTVPEDYYAL